MQTEINDFMHQQGATTSDIERLMTTVVIIRRLLLGLCQRGPQHLDCDRFRAIIQ